MKNTRLTLVGKLDNDLISLAGRGEPPVILSPGRAVAWDVESIPQADFEALKNRYAAAGVDAFLMPHRQAAKLFLADMDSTTIGQEVIDEIADEIGIKPKIAAITESAMRGELDFTDALTARVALLEGVTTAQLDRVLARLTINEGMRELVTALKAQGCHCILVSGGFTYFADHIAKAAGFDVSVANILEIENGRLTGKLIFPIIEQMAKRAILIGEAGMFNAEMEDVIAVGDGANDIPMLQAAGAGFAYKAKDAVNAVTKHHIRHSDLRAIGYAIGLQGI